MRTPVLTPPPSARPPGGTLTPDEVLARHDAVLADHGGFAPHFRRAAQRHWALTYTEGPLLPLARTSLAPLADALVGGDVQALPPFVGLGAWDDDAVLATQQQLVAEALGEPAAGVRIVDGCDCPKQGAHSVGVARHRPAGTRPARGVTRWATAASPSTRAGSPTPLPTAPSRHARS